MPISSHFSIPTMFSSSLPIQPMAQFGADLISGLLISSFATVRGARGILSVQTGRRPCRQDPSWKKLLAYADHLRLARSTITARRTGLVEIGVFDPEIQRMQDREMLLRFALALRSPCCRRKSIGRNIRPTIRSPVSRAAASMPIRHCSANIRGFRKRYPGRSAMSRPAAAGSSPDQGHFAEAMSGFRINRSSSAMGYSLSSWHGVADGSAPKA